MFDEIGKNLLKLSADVDALANRISELNDIDVLSMLQIQELDKLNMLQDQILDVSGCGELNEVFLGFCDDLINTCNKITNVVKLLTDEEE